MDFFWFVLIGLFAGVFAGMGMGGGTFLIPLLTLVMGVPLKQAQLFNLLVFLPMAIITIIIYARKKLIDFKSFLVVCVPAITLAILGALLSSRTPDKVIKIIFGVFLIVLAVVNIVLIFIKNSKTRSKN